jgi:hypothetical protein
MPVRVEQPRRREVTACGEQAVRVIERPLDREMAPGLVSRESTSISPVRAG